MQDSFGRQIEYLRISVTDRCNFRCQYCMPEQQTFLPAPQILDYAEITQIAGRFIAHGVRKIRLTGGEPLARRNVERLITALGVFVHSGQLEELTLTTNGSLLEQHIDTLLSSGVRRVNVSLDTLDADRFMQITRGGNLNTVMRAITAAIQAGLAVKLNMVAMRGVNEDDLLPMVDFCAHVGADLTLIEQMPLGNSEHDRQDSFMALDTFCTPLHSTHKLSPTEDQTPGPARYWSIEGMNVRLGMITPMSQNFCDNCNRMRLTTDGKVYMCLGSDLHVDLKTAIRAEGSVGVDRLLQKALRLKPQRHDFEKQLYRPDERLTRHMNATGG